MRRERTEGTNEYCREKKEVDWIRIGLALKLYYQRKLGQLLKHVSNVWKTGQCVVGPNLDIGFFLA